MSGQVKTMNWFTNKNNDNIFTKPEDMSPLEAVTYLCAAIQLADGKADYEERKAWINAVKELFPEFSEDRADKFLISAQKTISLKHGNDKYDYIIKIMDRIKTILDEDKIKLLGPKLSELIEADGIVMTAELEIASIIEKGLDISIPIRDDI